MYKVCFIQPIVASYRDPIFQELNTLLQNDLLVCAAPTPSEFGEINNPQYELHYLTWSKLKFIYFMPLKSFLNIFRRGNRFVHFADFRFVSLWALLFGCRLFNKKVWLHGQGGYKKSGKMHRWVYTLSVMLSSGYICYTDYSAQHLKSILPPRLHKKVYVVNNTLELEPANNISDSSSDSLLYMGRLREGCGIEMLLQAASKLDIEVRIVGAGSPDFIDKLKAIHPKTHFYGAVFDYNLQKEIAHSCFAGVYAGDAGLSVVHYMALGLPVIVHDDIARHRGPEPSYVKDGVNGLQFVRGNIDSLCQQITTLRSDPLLRIRLAEGSLETFKQLRHPSMAMKFAAILENR